MAQSVANIENLSVSSNSSEFDENLENYLFLLSGLFRPCF